MAFGAGAFVAVPGAPTTGILVGCLSHFEGAVAYEAGTTGPVTINGRLCRAGNGAVGFSFLRLLSVASSALAAKVDGGATAAGADNGVFWSGQVLTANLCNLPSNFGPGAGNWTAANVLRLDVDVRFIGDAVAISQGTILHYDTVLAAGDISIIIKNCSLMVQATAADLQVDLRYRHSIEE